MVFSSPIFLFLFLPLTLFLVYAVTPEKFRNGVLLFMSLLFYFWGEAGYALIMVVSIVLNYSFGLWIGKAPDVKKAKIALSVTIIINLGMLVYFKYADFIIQNFNLVFRTSFRQPVVHLPAGISFFTFHSLSYCIDVYRKGVKAQRSFSNIALYISFFPQLIAGPIIRYHDVADQLVKRYITAQLFTDGLKRFIVGLAKKLIIANTMGSMADVIFNSPVENINTPIAWIGCISYTLQIYFDFSGYSDMAIGMAKMFGFNFLENFNYPYISQSIKDFWRRWHISLSNWFRDYLYIPLGGNRLGTARTYFNLLIVFFITGLWHGASWTFIFWGLWHGSFLVIERLGFEKVLLKIPRIFRHAYALGIVMIGWVFFRANDFDFSMHYLKAMLSFSDMHGWLDAIGTQLNGHYYFCLALGLLFSMPVMLKVENWCITFINVKLRQVLLYPVYLVYIAVFVVSCMYMASSTYNPFIYFRF